MSTLLKNPEEFKKTKVRHIKYAQAIREALDICLEQDPNVYIMGLGVPDPKGVFGTTLDLQKKFGKERVLDMPTSENGMTGVAIGTALLGMRPVMVHQRIDFALLAMEQIVNQAAKWHYMFGGQMKVSLVIRLIIGRGWGQGPQHSQNLHAWFAHIPGLKVVMPSTAYDAKGLLISSIEDNNPVIFLEHRWLHNTTSDVPQGTYRVPLGSSRIVKEGNDITIASLSYGTVEALHAAEYLAQAGIEAEILDIRCLRPFDSETLLKSVVKTGRLLVLDTSWTFGGFSGEIIAQVAETVLEKLKAAPRRLGMSDNPVPTSPALSKEHYPSIRNIVEAAFEMVGKDKQFAPEIPDAPIYGADVPDPTFTGPF